MRDIPSHRWQKLYNGTQKDISNFKAVFAPTYCLLLFSFSIYLVHFKGTYFNCYLLHPLHYLKFHSLLYNIEMTDKIIGTGRRKMSNYQFQAADSCFPRERILDIETWKLGRLLNIVHSSVLFYLFFSTTRNFWLQETRHLRERKKKRRLFGLYFVFRMNLMC